jgi:hypothetical protein
VSLVASSHAVSLATARSPPSGRGANISAAIIEMREPGRSTHARARSRATGMAPRMSSVNRPTRNPESPASSSISLVISASGGEPCWISRSQLLRVPSVDSKT